jgi:hypothetical protein
MTARNMRSSLKEKVVYISPDGLVYNLHDTALETLITMTGWGIPAVGKATTKGPFQHGVTPLTLRVPPRKITMTIHNRSCDRDSYWQSREDLINVIRYNRGGLDSPEVGHLRWYRSDGQIRQLDVILAGGPEFTPLRNGWAEFSFQDVLVWEADNPIIYNPLINNQTFVGFECTPIIGLQFGFVFGRTNIVFNGSYCSSLTDISVPYPGNWMEFPRIIVTGPGTNFSITHNELGWTLELENYTIAAGETITFDLTYGKKTITNNLGDSLLGYLSSNSEIGLFSIQPDPIVANGINTFSVFIEDGTTDTNVLFNYNDRYIAI